MSALPRTVTRRRRGVNLAAGVGITGCVAAALAPLIALMVFTAQHGATLLSGNFLTHSMAGVGPLAPGGGIYHAMVGTLEQITLASGLAVPVGLLVAIGITEQPVRGLTAAVRFLVDVMTGIPSIVAGLFVFAFWVVGLHRGFSGFAGSLALAIIMLPVVVRTAEEMLLLVPRSVREAAWALGLPRWRTIWSVVIPAARTGITTGALLAVARVTGETAPLLLTVGNNSFINTNPLRGAQASLPVFVFSQSGSAFDVAVRRAWAGALVLVGFVVVLYLTARFLTRNRKLG
ncbi:MAG TPA: phosphate ABC transporter permease PstA [Mycobacteriales bacterium]|nr:phosphate ABC transporter permease PstA [Mycobacteriales bacterium]